VARLEERKDREHDGRRGDVAVHGRPQQAKAGLAPPAAEPEVGETLDERVVRQLSTRELSSELFAHLGLLVREQVALARAELKQDVKLARRAGILLGAAGVLALMALTLLAVALAQVIAFKLAAPLASLIVAGGLVLIALPLGLIGYRSLPRQPLQRTRQEIEEEIQWTRTQLA
jgi:hypothetical protein